MTESFFINHMSVACNQISHWEMQNNIPEFSSNFIHDEKNLPDIFRPDPSKYRRYCISPFWDGFTNDEIVEIYITYKEAKDHMTVLQELQNSRYPRPPGCIFHA
jgi:hypothetical protein